MREIYPGRVYRHFKNKYYLVTDIAIHSETEERYVVYRQLYGEGLVYVRPYDMFASETDREKYPDVAQKYRFECVNAYVEPEDEVFDREYEQGGWRLFREDGEEYGLDPADFDSLEDYEAAVQQKIADQYQGY